MAKHRKKKTQQRKPRPPRQRLPALTPPPSGTPKKGRFRALFDRMLAHPFVALISLFAALGAIAEFVIPQFYGPEIYQSAASADDPFALHFKVHNPSKLFGMHAVDFACWADDVKWSTGAHATDNTFAGFAPITDIDPGQTVEYRCPFEDAVKLGGTITSASVKVSGSFLSLWIWRRTFQSPEFNWDRASRQWNEGKQIN